MERERGSCYQVRRWEREQCVDSVQYNVMYIRLILKKCRTFHQQEIES